MKFCLKRKRPTSKSVWQDLLVDKYSFPSGHASRAVLTTLLLFNVFATELCWCTTQLIVIGLLIYVTAFLACMSRFLLARHYVSDVLAGVLLGVFNYFFILYFFAFLF